MRRAMVLLSCSLLFALAFTVQPTAQSKPTLKPADYDQFESVSPGALFGGLSPDGKWLAYTITKVSGDSELRITQVGGTTTKTVPFGAGASFSSNSQWIAYGIGQSEAEAERLRTARQPVQRKLGLLNLATNTETITNGIESFAFDRTGQSLAMKRYAPVPAGGAAPAAPAPAPAGRGGGAAAPASVVGTTLMVRNLATGADTTFGNVSEYAWQPTDDGRLLAMVISADGQAGNGVYVFNAETSVLRALESATADYSSLTWRDDSADLVVLKSKTDDKRDGPTQVALAWLGVGRSSERLIALESHSEQHTSRHATHRHLPPAVVAHRPVWSGADDHAGRRGLGGEAGARKRGPRRRPGERRACRGRDATTRCCRTGPAASAAGASGEREAGPGRVALDRHHRDVGAEDQPGR